MSGFCVPCKCAKNSVGQLRQSHANLNVSRMLLGCTYNEQGFVQAWYLKIVCPQPLLIEKQMYKISCKSSAMLVKPELKLIANCSRLFQRQALLAAIHLCVSSEAAFVMRAGLSMGEVEQPSPSNRLYAALL